MVSPLRHSGMNLTTPFTLPFCTPPHASTPSRCSCQRCKKDKQSPKLFSSDNNMDPGSVPAELQGLTQTEEMLIARCCRRCTTKSTATKESYRLSSTCGASRNHTNVAPVDAHV